MDFAAPFDDGDLREDIGVLADCGDHSGEWDATTVPLDYAAGRITRPVKIK
jgi:hypothetical protein